ncbi:MAG TPA: hypothetical protein VFZ93_11925 [Albitalea sp.]
MSMHDSPRHRAPSRAWPAALAVACGVLAGPAVRAADCQMACRGKDCLVQGPAGEATLSDERYETFSGCEQHRIVKGDVELRYKHRKAWFSPPEAITGALAEVFRKFPADTCSLPTKPCLQQRMQSLAGAVGGSGIDDRISEPAGRGDPCAMGFPCDRIVPPPQAWRFALGDASLSGTWVVRLARGIVAGGQGSQTIGRVERGVVTADGRWFLPGTQCVYAFVDDDGKPLATGQFSVVSRTTHDNLQELARRRVAKGLPPAIAWIDTLMASQLEWDAMQGTLRPKENP